MRIYATHYNPYIKKWTFGEVISWDKETNSIKTRGLFRIYDDKIQWIETAHIRKIYFTDGETLCEKIRGIENFEKALYVINNEYPVAYNELVNTRVFYGTCDEVKIKSLMVEDKIFIYICGNIKKATEIAITKYPK